MTVGSAHMHSRIVRLQDSVFHQQSHQTEVDNSPPTFVQFGITTTHTTSYHPQANGLVEQLHRQLRASLRFPQLHDMMNF